MFAYYGVVHLLMLFTCACLCVCGLFAHVDHVLIVCVGAVWLTLIH